MKVYTLGCRLNFYESDVIRTYLKKNSIEDVYVINTCSVTKESLRKSKQIIRRIKKENPHMRVFVTGCAVETYRDEIPLVDGILDNSHKNNVAYLNRFFKKDRKKNTQFYGEQERKRKFIQIQNGCNHNCTFCNIPKGRGSSFSFSIAKILDTIKYYDNENTEEIVLTGVDISSWGEDLDKNMKLGDLVENILSQIKYIKSVRLSSIDVAEIDSTLKNIFSCKNNKLASYLHLSLQSGNNIILKRMKRRHLREDAIDFCHNMRSMRPDIGIGADIIAGFPTETEKMFQDTCNIIRECQISFAHIFPFSSNSNTVASKMPQVNNNVIKERALILRQEADRHYKKFLDSHIGKVYPIIRESERYARLSNFSKVYIHKLQNIEYKQNSTNQRKVFIEKNNGKYLQGQYI